MSIDKKLQCKGSYKDYQTRHAANLLRKMSQEERKHLMEEIQTRQLLFGKQIQNQAVFNLVAKKVK